MEDNRWLRLVTVGLILAVLTVGYLVIKKASLPTRVKSCEVYADQYIQNVPARCYKYFQKGDEQ